MDYHNRLPLACPRHPERSLEQVCCDCDLAMCWKCLVADHGPHKARELKSRDLFDPALRVPGRSRLNTRNTPVTMTTTNADTNTTTTTTSMTLALDKIHCDCKYAPVPLDARRDEQLLLEHADLRKDALFLQDEMDAFEFLDAEADALRHAFLDRGGDSLILKACQDWAAKLLGMGGAPGERVVHQDGDKEPPVVDAAAVCKKDTPSLGCEKEALFVEMDSLRRVFLGTDRDSLTVDSVLEQAADPGIGKGAALGGKGGRLFEAADTFGELFPVADKRSPFLGAVSGKDVSPREGRKEAQLLREMGAALVVLDKMTGPGGKDVSLGAEGSCRDADDNVKDNKDTAGFGQREVRADEVSALRGKEWTLHGVK